MNKITAYIGNRFHALKDVTARDIQEFEERSSQADRIGFERGLELDANHARVFHYDPDLAERGIGRLAELDADIEEIPCIESDRELEERAQFLWGIDRQIFATRGLVDLGPCAVDIEVKRGKCSVLLNGKVLLRDIEASQDDFSGQGTVEVCYDTTSEWDDRLLLISRPGHVIATVSYGPEVDKGRKIPEITTPRHFMLEALRHFDEIADIIVKGHFGIQSSSIVARTPKVVESLYLGPVMDSVPDEYVDETLNLFRVGGLNAVLGGDRDLAEALALTSVTCQAAPMRAFVERELEKRNLPTNALDSLLELSDRTIPLLRSEEALLLAFV